MAIVGGIKIWIHKRDASELVSLVHIGYSYLHDKWYGLVVYRCNVCVPLIDATKHLASEVRLSPEAHTSQQHREIGLPTLDPEARVRNAAPSQYV